MKKYRDRVRRCQTVGGNAIFHVAGSVADGVRMWVGKSKQPLTFDQAFFERLLEALGDRGDIRIGSKFDDPGPESLGQWIQQDRKIAMNPAVYVGGLLVDEGYAESPRRGRIRIHREPVFKSATTPSGEVSPKEELSDLIERLDERQAATALKAVMNTLGEAHAALLLEVLRGDPDFILPSAPRRSVRSFEPIELEGPPLSGEIIENRR